MMRSFIATGMTLAMLLCSAWCAPEGLAAEDRDDDSYWAGPMSEVHERFNGKPGTYAHFGDSITVSMAFWTPLAEMPKGLSPEELKMWQRVKEYMRDECWRGWKGPEFGNQGGMTIRWAHEHVDEWLKRLNPEVALIMFGTNDIGQVGPDEYREKTRDVVRRCLANGTIVILNTIPPRSGRLSEARELAQIAKEIAREEKVPLVDYFQEVLQRRPEDWDGSLAKFRAEQGDDYQVPTLISRDGVHPSFPSQFAGDFGHDALAANGYSLRSYLVLREYAHVIERVLQPEQ